MKKIVKKIEVERAPKVMKKKCVHWEACPNEHMVKNHGNGEYSIDLHYCPNPMTDEEHELFLEKLAASDPDDEYLLWPEATERYGWKSMSVDNDLKMKYVMENGKLFIRQNGNLKLPGEISLHLGGTMPINVKQYFPPNTAVEMSALDDATLGGLVKVVARDVMLMATTGNAQVVDFYIFGTTPNSGDWGRILKIAYRAVKSGDLSLVVIHDKACPLIPEGVTDWPGKPVPAPEPKRQPTWQWGNPNLNNISVSAQAITASRISTPTMYRTPLQPTNAQVGDHWIDDDDIRWAATSDLNAPDGYTWVASPSVATNNAVAMRVEQNVVLNVTRPQGFVKASGWGIYDDDELEDDGAVPLGNWKDDTSQDDKPVKVPAKISKQRYGRTH